MKHNLLALLILLSGCAMQAGAQTITLEQAREAYSQGDYDQAAGALASAADAEPKNANINHMAGVALMRTGDFDRAARYLKRGTDESLLYLARIAVDKYDFDGAEELVEKFEESRSRNKRKNRNKQPVENPQIFTEVEETLERGRSMLERVEKIVVIDSIAVPRDDFFKAYRLASSAGTLKSVDVLPEGFSAADPTVVHVTQGGNSMIWAVPDSSENFVLAEATRLADGSWEGPLMPSGELGNGGDVNYPFLMSDGVTLYFASDGEGSLGGYDIFISRRDGDGFLQPQNVGMPYNSPFDDYMLAIDEETGTGWWATDRNRLGDSITIYRFIPSELRVNYPSDTPGLAGLAILSDYKATWEQGADYSALIAAPANKKDDRKDPSFRFAMPDGRVLTHLADFKNRHARSLMSDYLEMKSELERIEKNLNDLRAAYGRGDRSKEAAINKAEKQITSLRNEIARKRNEIVTASRQ